MEINIDSFFGNSLKQIRRKKHITQEDLADMAKLDRTYISLLERGLRKPSLEAIMSIAKSLDISACEFVKDVEHQLKAK
jgi:transcriptional regulator with XRE-family HTH domain